MHHRLLHWLILGVCTAWAFQSGCAAGRAQPASILPNDKWNCSASSQENDLAPGFAADGLVQTRWSSAFANHQWWMIDFGKNEVIGSLQLRWEVAFAKSYSVLTSMDGEKWVEVYSSNEGVGGEEVVSFNPHSARFVKIDLRERATEWGFSLYEIEFNPSVIARDELIREASASTGKNDYKPGNAVDGNASTRWSSDFSDKEWWQVEFNQPQTIGGVNILWEAAFAEKYSIDVSQDGLNWKTVYDVTEGDGQTDLLFFAPVNVRYVRIYCTQRGTGWGNSIWEVSFLIGDQIPTVTATSTAEGSAPEFAMDGRLDTAWQSAGDGDQELIVSLSSPLELGGMVLKWQNNFATDYEIQSSMDGDSWNTLASNHIGSGGTDYLYFPSSRAQFVRIICHRSSGETGYALAQLELKGGNEQATPLRHYMAKARDAHPELYPMWLNRQQEFWTVTGLPGEEHETLLGETGITEPQKGAFSVQPFVLADGKLVTWADVQLEQILVDDYLPIPSVSWSKKSWKLEIASVMSGPTNARFSAVRYRFINNGDEAFTGKLALVIRPVQLTPGWQHGGFSPIYSAKFVPAAEHAAGQFLVEGKERIALLTPPERTGAAALNEGDVSDYLEKGDLPDSQEASDAEGKVSAGLIYDLFTRPGATTDIVVMYPLYPESHYPDKVGVGPSASFDVILAESHALWSDWLMAPRIEIPEKRLIDVLKSNLGYVLINRDGPWFKPGPRNYNHAWMRDGVLSGLATMRCGINDMVKEFITEYSKHIRSDGWVPWMILESGNPITFNADPSSGEGQEYDSQGQFPFIVRQYYDYTGDDELVRKVYPQVVAALHYAHMLRERRMTEEYLNDENKRAYFGILPLSNSHEGYYPAKHSHWDNFWLLRGLKDGAYLARKLGHEEDALWMEQEEMDMRKALYKSIITVINKNDMEVIPGCVELADTDPTSTSIAIMIAEENNYLPQPYGSNTFEYYWNELNGRMKPHGEKLYTPYEVRNADVFVRLGWRERALAQLRYFASTAIRPPNWNHMAEVVHVNPRAPAYIGDMPHTWVGSDYINAVRTLFAYEDGEALVLAAGIDPAWLEQGVAVDQLPTQFGRISYHARFVDGEVIITLQGDAHPPGGFVIPVPASLSEKRIIINGEPHDAENGLIRLGSLHSQTEKTYAK